MDTRIATSLHTGLLIAAVGVFAWVTGLPALFPSLGPSAFVLAMFPAGEASNPRRVIGSHVLGVAAGLLTYHLIAPGVVVTGQIAPLSVPGLRLAASSVLAIVLTVTGMLHFDIRHPPACATTLIVSLGLLSEVSEGLLMIVAVVGLVVLQGALLRINDLSDRIERASGE